MTELSEFLIKDNGKASPNSMTPFSKMTGRSVDDAKVGDTKYSSSRILGLVENEPVLFLDHPFFYRKTAQL